MDNQLLQSKISSLEVSGLDALGLQAKFEERRSPDSIDKLGRINIFIGSNNAGKSRFMRAIANATPQKFAYAMKGFDNLETLLQEMQADFNNDVLQHPRVSGVAAVNVGVQKELRRIDFTQYKKEFLEAGTDPFNELAAMINSFLNQTASVTTYRSTGPHDEATLRTLLLDFANKHISTIELIHSMSGQIPVKPVCYIPALRSLNEFGAGGGTDKDDFIGARIRSNYGLGEHVDIFTGQRIYKRIRSLLLGDHSERAKIKSYEDFLSQKIFDGKSVTIIPKEKYDVVDVKIDNEEKRIYELGDGIQALIILTFPLFEYDYGLFFIEEPEVNLHPGMQRKLLEAFQEKRQHQYFLTTHSNHFLDLTIQYRDISVYLCKKLNGKCEVEVVAYGDRSVLEEIGVQNTSVFLTNKTIWVEGITDRLYIARFLELYIQKKKLSSLVEDQDYSYVEYGGGNITHWSFVDKIATDSSSAAKINAKRLCGQMILVADKDAAGTKKARKKTLKEELGDRFIELGSREIENLLSPATIAAIIQEYEGRDTGVFGDVQHKEYKVEYLGTFIDKKFDEKNIKRKRDSYQADSGTVKDKTAFCKKALKHLKDFDDLTPEAQKLARTIYKFVKDQGQ